MIDLIALRADPALVSKKIKSKDTLYPIERLIELDATVRELSSLIETKRAHRNMLAQQAQAGVTESIREESKAVGAAIKRAETELEAVHAEFKDLYLRCPNIPSDVLPIGDKTANTVVRMHGKQPTFAFAPRNHVELGTALGWLDFEAAAQTSGSQFALYRDQAVRLHYALSFFLFNNAVEHGFRPILPPYLINEKTLEGASNFPRFKDEVYALERDGLYLTPTAEVNLTALYRDKILDSEQLPLRHCALTSCFRREAGGYGGAERGLIRIHQFDKVEIYTITTPEQSMDELERMVAVGEEALKKLGLHYRVSLLATGDSSFASAKTYDIEVWMPGQKEYKEVSSASNCTDFQARRSAIRYRPHAQDKAKLVHTLNASALALPRLVVSLMETYQQADGSIAIPDVLKSITLRL